MLDITARKLVVIGTVILLIVVAFFVGFYRAGPLCFGGC
jgi:hypothetical protein